MATVNPYTCKWCRCELWMLDGSRFGVHICRRCDSAPATNPGNRLWATAPNVAGTKNGWWLPPKEWTT